MGLDWVYPKVSTKKLISLSKILLISLCFFNLACLWHNISWCKNQYLCFPGDLLTLILIQTVHTAIIHLTDNVYTVKAHCGIFFWTWKKYIISVFLHWDIHITDGVFCEHVNIITKMKNLLLHIAAFFFFKHMHSSYRMRRKLYVISYNIFTNGFRQILALTAVGYHQGSESAANQ